MAFSKSLQKGQIALFCQMCEESSEIKWKCLTCESFMCTKCCKIHRKFKSSDQHNIVDLKDLALHSSASGTTPDFTNINCCQHKDQKCCLYCKGCEEVVCLVCITKVHNTHKMVDISEGYQVSLSKIKDMNSQVEGDILKFTKDISKLDSIKTSEQSHYKMQKEKILSHEKAVKDALEKHTKKLLTDLDQRWKILESTVSADEAYGIKVRKDLETENKVLSEALDSNNASEVFKVASARSQLKRGSPKPVNIKYQRLPQFFPGEINPYSIESIHGTLEEIKEQKFQIEVKEQYTTTLPAVSALVCCDDGSMWICDSANSTIQNVNISHGSIQVKRTIKTFTTSIALTSTGDILLSTLDNKLQIIQHTTGEVKDTMFCVTPFTTVAVHISKDIKILVGIKDSGPSFPAKGPRQVVVMDMEGRQEQVYQYDNKKKPLFTYPYKITTDKENNIYVIDVLSNIFNGRVVVLGQGGSVRGIYTGHPDVNDTEHQFIPCDIVTTQSINVIVSDSINHTLNILNNGGQCLQCLNTKHLGIKFPRSLYIDYRGFLFIGCSSADKELKNAKIHMVQLINV